MVDRRTLLKLSLAGGAGLVLAPGVAFADDTFPPVPGMQGDRRANELWYHFDQVAFYDPVPGVAETYQALGDYTGNPNFVEGFMTRWLELSKAADYPANYTAWAAPVRDELQFLSDLQLKAFDRFYAPGSAGFVDAFGYFGQGVLFDPRRAELQQQVHTMAPITNYQGWHAYLRAMMFLEIDRDRWARINPVLAFAWATQSIALPDTNTPNPGLPRPTMAQLAATWLPRSSERLDKDFQSVPYPA
ncbi:hypothetical protein [Actinocrispum sp. NPDC049592]|uniref:hypothetical protein n=1 Tax=Actinocrispum sp. NPDC049592 TaxID=3154835 RepID=UPI00341C62F1